MAHRFHRLAIAALAASVCPALPALAQDAQPADTNQATMVDAASAVMMDQSGNTLGTLLLEDSEQGVRISGQLTGIANGEHGFHIHEFGACTAEDKFESAGAHYAPEPMQHGLENPEGPHAGDLEAVSADDDGNVTIDQITPRVRLAELMDNDGSALVIHADPDDQKTDPSGNSGERFACGVVDAAQ